jgi:hypothetical protein
VKVQSEGFKNLCQLLANWSYWLLKLIDLRLAVVIGVGMFLMAVGVDSSGNYATAADLRQASVPITRTASDHPQPQPQPQVQPQSNAKAEASYLEFDPAIANRLRQGDITSASLTSSRLTKAHFFTDSFRVSPR